MHHITIEGINLYGYHGCLEEEAKIGGQYVISVRLSLDFSEAAQSDDLTKTIDYCTVYEICKTEMAVRSKLIEHVCSRIHKTLHETFLRVHGISVRVTKLSPPMNGDVDKVSVEISD